MDDLRAAIEALLFASERPLTPDEMKSAFDSGVSAADIRAEIEVLRSEYDTQARGFRMYEIAGGFQLASDIRFAETLKRFYQSREKKRISQAGLETLSVIAYRQPVTRAEIEAIRGVNVDGSVKTLMEKGLIRISGRKEVPGRPILYGTTQEFLEHFGLKSVQELPALSEYSLKDLDPNLLPPELKAENVGLEISDRRSEVGDEETEANGG